MVELEKIKPNIPKTDVGIENDYKDCEERKRFVEADKSTFKDYLERAKDDLLSGKKDIEENDLYWSVIKIYQSIYFALNAILIKNLGFFSKDHKCLLTILLKKELLNKNISDKINIVFELRKKVEEADIVRQERNIALYHPKSKELITKKNAEDVLAIGQKVLNFSVEVLL